MDELDGDGADLAFTHVCRESRRQGVFRMRMYDMRNTSQNKEDK